MSVCMRLMVPDSDPRAAAAGRPRARVAAANALTAAVPTTDHPVTAGTDGSTGRLDAWPDGDLGPAPLGEAGDLFGQARVVRQERVDDLGAADPTGQR
jgi:hypothetical protein